MCLLVILLWIHKNQYEYLFMYVFIVCIYVINMTNSNNAIWMCMWIYVNSCEFTWIKLILFEYLAQIT
jgi:hypothetical protein